VNLRWIAFTVACALALGAAVGAAAHPLTHSTGNVEKVAVTAKDFSFKLSPTTVHHGSVTFTIKNAGKTRHDFAIAGHTSKTIAPGKSTTMTVTLKAGKYPYRCTVDSHAKLGMKGTLHVT